MSAGQQGLSRYRVVVLGDGGVGKSALTLQYVQHSFIEYHDPTIEDAYQHRTVIDGRYCSHIAHITHLCLPQASPVC